MSIKRIFLLPLLALLFVTGVFGQKRSDMTRIRTRDPVVYGVSFTENGEALAVADDQVINVFSVRTLALLNTFAGGHTDRIMSVDISFDSTLMVSGGKDGTLVIWDFTTARIIETLHSHNGIITSVQLSPDCRYLVSGGTDDRVVLYDMMQNRITHEFTLHDDDVTSVVFSPDGQWLASSGADGKIFLYDTRTFQVADTLSGHKSWVRSLCFNRDGTRLLSCGDDGQVITWDLEDPAQISKQYINRVSLTWILTLDVRGDDWVYACGDLNGRAYIVTHFGTYRAGVGAPVTRILFKPTQKELLMIAVATRGNGVVLLDGIGMKWNQKKRSR